MKKFSIALTEKLINDIENQGIIVQVLKSDVLRVIKYLNCEELSSQERIYLLTKIDSVLNEAIKADSDLESLLE